MCDVTCDDPQCDNRKEFKIYCGNCNRTWKFEILSGEKVHWDEYLGCPWCDPRMRMSR